MIDATTVAEELQSNYYVKTELIVNPSLKEIIEKIREYAKLTYSSKDNLLVFFAGHGIYDEVLRRDMLFPVIRNQMMWLKHPICRILIYAQ